MFKEGAFQLKGGQFIARKTEEKIFFKRYSWYKELSLSFDLLIGEVEKESSFYSWISEDMKDELKKCKKLLVSFIYYPDKYKNLFELVSSNLDRKGLNKISLIKLEENLKMHPDLDQFFSHNYIYQSFCSKEKQYKSLMIQLPGFERVKLKI